MNKSLDGIKKLNREELARGRKIVLRTIGEKENAESGGISPLEQKVRKTVDAVRGTVKAAVAPVSAASLSALPEKAEKEKNNIETERVIKKKEKKEKKKAEGDRDGLPLLPEKEKINSKKPQKNKFSLAPADKGKKKIKKKIKPEKKRKPKSKRDFLAKPRETKKMLKKYSYFFLIFIAVFLVAYFSLALSLNYFGFDNKFFRRFSSFLPVPAMITSFGMIEYYDYRDGWEEEGRSGLSENEAKEKVKRDLIRKSIEDKILAERPEGISGAEMVRLAQEKLNTIKVWSLVR